ncbi:hypothetical protein PMIN03_003070 [Paraphaeosphaeria minitans]
MSFKGHSQECKGTAKSVDPKELFARMKRERLQKDDLSQHREGEVANLKRQRQTLEQQLAAATSKADKMRKEKESAMQKMEGLREQLKANGSQVKSSSTPEVTNNILHITINAFYMRPLWCAVIKERTCTCTCKFTTNAKQRPDIDTHVVT